MYSKPDGRGEPGIQSEENQPREKWTPKQQEPMTHYMHYPQASNNTQIPALKSSPAFPLLQHVAQERQSVDASILPNLLLGLASLFLLVTLPQLSWVVGPRPQTGLLLPKVQLIEGLLGVQRPRLENDEMCGITTGGQVITCLFWSWFFILLKPELIIERQRY